uniref:Uncharacterized protein n=1 Tax=Malurus cyaneus samueli TaxID=2593467 RepID=A0A8C5UBS4_9PASS
MAGAAGGAAGPRYTPLVAACLCLAEGGVNLWSSAGFRECRGAARRCSRHGGAGPGRRGVRGRDSSARGGR